MSREKILANYSTPAKILSFISWETGERVVHEVGLKGWIVHEVTIIDKLHIFVPTYVESYRTFNLRFFFSSDKNFCNYFNGFSTVSWKKYLKNSDVLGSNLNRVLSKVCFWKSLNVLPTQDVFRDTNTYAAMLSCSEIVPN